MQSRSGFIENPLQLVVQFQHCRIILLVGGTQVKYSKIAIVGAGNVGSTIAYACMLQNIAAEIMLTDINENCCKGQVIDLEDALAFSRTSRILQGSIKDAGQADIIIICAGAKQLPDQKRTELINANKKVFEHIFSAMQPIRKDAIIIIVTNPVDLMTLYAHKLTNHPHNLLFGSGTYLDTQRLRVCISQLTNIAPESIHAYMLAEHGDSEFAAWSAARIAGNPVTTFKELTPSVLHEIEQKTRDKAYEIIQLKGATWFGIATCIAEICKIIIFDEKKALPLSIYHPTHNIYFSMPVILGSNGIEKEYAITLDSKEQAALTKSIEKIQNDARELG